QVFDDLWMDLYDLFEELRNLFKEEGLEPWTSCEFDFTREGKLKVSFDYIDWINSEFGQVQINQKLSEPETKKIYSQRKIDVEPVFGFMKAILGFTRMSVRGINKVKRELG
ncbi:TIGR01741 family protein, partial [Staphylococcus aureus]